ncbi:DUF992 domain-containing protein [Aestuariivirga sp.]|uniref:DUF992 domain-containing protein n=1 Tax=Aestuariivirga sp. TaxID=2650926 RepID=UPI0035934BB4
MKKIIAASLTVMALAITPAVAKDGVKVGVLTCNVDGGVGLIIGSSKAMDCTFERSGSSKVEHYTGRIGKLGVDIGITGKTTMGWAVFAPGQLKSGSLAGSYGGATAEATVAVGLGANVLVGGSNKSIALQPVSVQAQTGLNVAAGIASLKLEYAP